MLQAPGPVIPKSCCHQKTSETIIWDFCLFSIFSIVFQILSPFRLLENIEKFPVL